MADITNEYPRYTPRDRALRASDRDRDAVGEQLRRQHVAGRLDTDEFAERYGRCLEAKTYPQLDELIADLPGEEERAFVGGTGPVPQGNGRWGPRRALGRVPVFFWLALGLALAVLSGGHLAWVAFPLLFFVFRPFIWRSAWRRGGRGPGGWCSPWGCGFTRGRPTY